MSAPTPTAAPRFGRMLAYLGLLLAAAILAAAAAYGAWYLANAELQKQSAAAMDQLRALTQKQDELAGRMARVEQAAADARLLVNGAGLQEKLAELERLKAEVEQAKQEAAQRVAQLERSLREQIGAQGQQTAAAVAADLRLRGLIFKAHGQALKAKVDLAEGNRGLAKEEVALAVQTLRDAAAQAPERLRPDLEAAASLAEQARTALVLESGGARDQLNLLWQKVNALMGG